MSTKTSRRHTSKPVSRPSSLVKWLTEPDHRKAPLPKWHTTLPTVELSPEHQRIISVLPTLVLGPRTHQEAIRNLRAVREYVRGLPYVARPYGSQRPKQRGRPKGRGSLDPELSCRIAIAVDIADLGKAEVLRGLGRLPGGDSSAGDYRWLDRHLGEGRALLPSLIPRETRDGLKRAFPSLPEADRILWIFGKPEI